MNIKKQKLASDIIGSSGENWITELDNRPLMELFKLGGKNGAVLGLEIKEGRVEALVQGSRSKPYSVEITIDKLSKTKWKDMTEVCNRRIETMETLLSGEFPKEFDKFFSD